MTRSKFVALTIAAQLLIVAAACKDTSKAAAQTAATQVAEENDKGIFIPLTPSPDASSEQRLIIAAYNGDTPTVQRLVAEGADVNARYEIPANGVLFSVPSTPGARPTVGQPAAGAGVGIRFDLVDHLGKSALNEALSRGRLELAGYLLDHGADINARESGGIPALQNALFDPKTLDFLIAKGADVNAKNNEGDSPLYYAAALTDLDTIKKLLKAGADVNARDNRGETALHIVRDAPTARLLLGAGARVDLKDDRGFTPLMNFEWSIERITRERAPHLIETTSHGWQGGSFVLVARDPDLQELERLGFAGEALAHRLNDLRSTEEKGIARVLKSAGTGSPK